MNTHRIGAAVAAVTLVSGLAAAGTTPVSYIFTGVGSGSLAGTGFTDAAFTIELDGFLEDVDTSGFPRFTDTTTTISIDGVVAVATFDDEMSVVSNTSSNLLVFGNWTLNSARAIMDVPALAGYTLGAPFGPVTDTSIGSTAQFGNEMTSAGMLDLSTISTMTFRAVPAPGAAGAFAFAGLLAARRRR